MSEQTNPWLEITKQKTEGVWNEVAACEKYEEIKNLYFHTPLLPKDCYDPDDLSFAEQFIMDVQFMTQGELTDAYFDYWSAEETERILQWFVNRNSMPLPHELVDYLYENGYWQK